MKDKRYFFAYLFGILLITSIAYASGQFKLVDGGGRDFGNSDNPMYITGNLGSTTSTVGVGTKSPTGNLQSNGDLVLKSPDGILNGNGDALDFYGCNNTNLCWKPNAAPSTTAGVLGIEYTDGTQVSFYHDGTNMVLEPSTGGVSTKKYFRAAMQTVTVADNGGGTAATGTVTPSSNNIRLQCNDTNGCTMSMSETGAQTGMIVVIVNNTTNTATFADSSGVLELAGGASFAMGQNDVLTIFYQNSTWLELSRSDN